MSAERGGRTWAEEKTEEILKCTDWREVHVGRVGRGEKKTDFAASCKTGERETKKSKEKKKKLRRFKGDFWRVVI